MAGVLDFSDYLGGPDNVNIEQIFPSTQRTLQYNFGRDITGWTFDIEHQTIVADSITFDRISGQPNFSGTTIIGRFPSGVISNSNVVVINASTGRVNITIPGGLYTGPIYADARKNVPITIVGVSWTDAGSPPQVNSHRWAFIQCYEPGVAPTDPTADPDYTAIG
jgi:hypothetical protein